MMSLYIQIHLFLAASWVLFRVLPKKRFTYRGMKGLAQILFVSSLMAMPVLAVLPDDSFPFLAGRRDGGKRC